MRKRLLVLLMGLLMVVMSAAPAMAHHDVAHFNQGHKLDDNPEDRDQGGGNNHLKLNRGTGND